MEKIEVALRKVILIGGSAGSLEVLLKVLPYLNPLNDFALVIVLHRKSSEDMTLESLLALKTPIPVKEVEDKTPLRPGFVYIAPSDYHLLFEKNCILSLDTSEKINHSRPSIDVSFESAADAFNTEVIGILLSGANSDGTAGLIAIQNAGGTTVVQNPDSADMSFMPAHAVANLKCDYILDAAGILKFINSVTS